MPEIGDINRIDYGRKVVIWDGENWIDFVPKKDILIKDILEDLSDGSRVEEVIEQEINGKKQGAFDDRNLPIMSAVSFTTSTAISSFEERRRMEEEIGRRAADNRARSMGLPSPPPPPDPDRLGLPRSMIAELQRRGLLP